MRVSRESKTRYGFDSFLAEFMFRVELGGCRGTSIGNRGTLDQGLILLGIEVR